jgi:pimeloyl-ACP methyl ester carboxylesterase
MPRKPHVPQKTHVRGTDIRGLGRLAIDATLGLTSLVETVHHNILRRPGPLGAATQAPAGGITGLVYRTIRGVTRLVGGSLDALLGQLAPLVGGGASSFEREAVLAALNGVLGDHLSDSRNPLAIEMSLRHDGQPLDLERAALERAVARPTGRILLLVHGLCMNDLQWRRKGHDHGAALAADCGFTPVYLRYNSGMHVSSNGRELAALIERLVHEWPVAVEQLVILAHSMGGLVTRSACRHAEQHARQSAPDWLGRTSDIFFLGTPHLGAPLERGGNWIDLILDASPYTTAFARLGKIRSAGITDLRQGNLCDEDWQRRDRFARAAGAPTHVPLPEGVRCHAIAGSLAKRADDLRERLLGDGLVPLGSALGQGADASRQLAIPKSRRWIRYGVNHLDLLDDRKVYEHIRKAF